MSESERGDQWRHRVAAVGLFALALAIRALPWPTVFTPERIELFGFDAYYHLRRVLYAVANFPALLDFDPYLKFPYGARSIWPPYFDGALAALALPFYRGDAASVERVAVWVPPLLGAATVVALHRLASRFLDARAALVAGLLLCVLSAHFWYTQLGFVDHHAAVALVSTLLLWSGMALLRALVREPADARADRRAALAVALAAAALLLIWPGGLLHVALLESGLLLFAATRPSARAAARAGEAVALHAGAAAAILLLAAARGAPAPWTAMSAVVLSHFQPWLFAAVALHGLGFSLACGRTRPAGGVAGRFALSLGLGLALLGASAALSPELLVSLREAWTWLAKEETFQASVGESQPLLEHAGRFTTAVAELRLSRFFYLYPAALAAWVWCSRQREDRAALWLAAGWSLGLCLVTLVQRRFMNCFAVAEALVVGWGCVELSRALARQLPPGAPRRAAPLAVSVAALVLLAPLRQAYVLPLRNARAALVGASLEPDRSRAQKLGPLQVAEWMRQGTPETAGFFDASRRPEYGVLAPWGDGHILQYVGRRPAVVDNFGDDLGPENFLAARRYFELPEEEAAELLDGLRVRYVVVRSGAGLRGEMFQALYAGDGTGLARHRMVYETPLAERTAHQPAIKVFELVAGARVVGKAPPGARVRATLSFLTPRGRRVAFASEEIADEDGSYHLRLPYATRGAPRRADRTRPTTSSSPAAAGSWPSTSGRCARVSRSRDRTSARRAK